MMIQKYGYIFSPNILAIPGNINQYE